jgi:hypothetical protein
MELAGFGFAVHIVGRRITAVTHARANGGKLAAQTGKHMHRKGVKAASLMAVLCAALQPAPVLADEGGASVWLPGQFASFAAVPDDPGFSLETIFYFRKASATAGTSFSRGGGLLLGYDTTEQYIYLTPGYTFAEPVLNGQLWLGVTFSAGRADTSVSGVLTGPRGNAFAAGTSDTATGISDLYPMATLKWQAGSNNVMTYLMASAPVGAYDPNRWAGVGIGHWALDWGMGYTYMPASGFEFSAVAGMTYNFVNPTTLYQSGMDAHIDVGTSWSFNDSLYVGAAGYFFRQVSPDTGGSAMLGDFRSQVAGAGPQIGWSLQLGGIATDFNVRGYKEFAAQNRPEGWNVWLTVSLSRVKRAVGKP